MKNRKKACPTKGKACVAAATERTTNIELYRILMMLLIIAHHYVVNSGLTAADGPIYAAPMAAHSLFLLLFGAWGKMGINCFLLITGYYMCTSHITVRKFAKMFFEVLFYRLALNTIFWLTGYVPFSGRSLFYTMFFFNSVATDFFNVYLYFFLLIPFLNILLRNITEKQLLRLLLLLLFLYVFLGTLPLFRVVKNYVSWFVVVYLTAAYIRLYPKRLFDGAARWGIITLSVMLFAAASVVLCAKYKEHNAYAYVMDSNTFFAYAAAVSSFLFFKNWKIPFCRFINIAASSTFGVLCIHANSNAMRAWLWTDTLQNVKMYATRWGYLHAVLSVLGVYGVCVLLDQMRIYLVEKPFFKQWDRHWPRISKKFSQWEAKICQRLHIQEDGITR